MSKRLSHHIPNRHEDMAFNKLNAFLAIIILTKPQHCNLICDKALILEAECLDLSVNIRLLPLLALRAAIHRHEELKPELNKTTASIWAIPGLWNKNPICCKHRPNTSEGRVGRWSITDAWALSFWGKIVDNLLQVSFLAENADISWHPPRGLWELWHHCETSPHNL